jgi:hypothetical protein
LKKFKAFTVLVTMALTGFMLLGLASDGQVPFTPCSLLTWLPESYPAVAGFYPGVWTVSTDGYSVFQSVNGQPTLFHSNFDVFNTEVEGTIQVQTTGDDDFIGFALGFLPGDTTNPDADYLLIDWKQADQWYDFGSPSCTPGCTAPAGLAVSRVFGIPTADEFWGHTNFNYYCSDLDNGLEELARGATLGDVGWSDGVLYTFRFEFGESYLRVYVNENPEPEIDLVVDIEEEFFSNGRIAFYNFSQASVNYEGYMVVVVNVGIDIKPGSDPNAFNNDGNGVIPVAILGSETFDVGLIIPTSVTMEGMALKTVGKADRALYHYEDVNGDGFEDLVIQIQDEDGVFEPGEGVATVTGLLVDGRTFVGSDSIKVTH